MAEIEEELSITILTETIKFITGANGDKIIIENIHLVNSQAATMAWLANKAPGTELTLELKVKE